MKRRITLTAIALSLMLTSCATSAEAPVDDSFRFSSVESAVQYAEAKGYIEQAALLADGDATEEDYRAANGVFRACLEELGYRFGPEITVDPVNGLQLHNSWQTVPEADVSARAGVCQDAFDTVEMSYVATHEKRMDSVLLADLMACASSQGIKVDDEVVTIDALQEGRSDTERAAIEGCLFAGLNRLFPDSEFVGY